MPVNIDYAAQAEMHLPPVAGCEAPLLLYTYRCQLDSAERAVGFNAWELPFAPLGVRFQGVEVDPIYKILSMQYSSDEAGLLLVQGKGAFPAQGRWASVPPDRVESVQVGGVPGEYVVGSFVASNLSGEVTWSDLPDFGQRLAWQVGERWFELILSQRKSQGQPGFLGKPELIAWGVSLVPGSPSEVADRLNSEHLFSVAQAEQLAGFSLRAPGKLPLGMRFWYAQYEESRQQVRLVYLGEIDLTIIEGKASAYELQDLSEYYSNVEQVEIRGFKGQFVNRVKSDRPAFLEGFADQMLAWQSDGMVYRILASNLEGGGQLGKAEMLAIAESMYDPVSRDPGLIRHIAAAYEELLKFDVEGFEPDPAGLVLNRVYGDLRERAMMMQYITKDGGGRLILWQGVLERDHPSLWEGVPEEVIVTVKIGSDPGKYARGNFSGIGAGLWQTDLPVQRLSWQDGERWFELVLESNCQAIDYLDQSGLIVLARSIQ